MPYRGLIRVPEVLSLASLAFSSGLSSGFLACLSTKLAPGIFTGGKLKPGGKIVSLLRAGGLGRVGGGTGGRRGLARGTGVSGKLDPEDLLVDNLCSDISSIIRL